MKKIIFLAIVTLQSALAFASHNPKMEVSPESWDFGKVTESRILMHKFKVKNVGDDTLEIKHLTTSCGCTTASIPFYKLYPDESTYLTAKLDLRQIKTQGRIKQDVFIESNDPENHSKIISLYLEYADIKPKATIQKQKPQINLTQPPKMSSKELYSRIQKGERIVILDVREENEYIGKHIPDAIWFPKSKFDKHALEVLKKLEGIDKKTMLVTYCGAGHRSSYVAKKLREAGYNAHNLDGISFWEKEDLPLIRGPKLPASEEPSIIHLEEAYENYYLLFKDIVWIDVRDVEDYKRGHVKGALGIPLSEIESRLSEIPKDKEIVFYCEGTWDGGSCEASRSAGMILIKNGYKQGNIKVFEDGYGAWENVGYPVVFAQDISALKADIYSKIGCITCKDMTIDKCNCPKSREMKAYIEAFLETGVSREEIFYKVAKKYSLSAIMDIKIRREVEERLIKEAGDKRPQIALDSSSFDFGGVSKKQGKISKIFKLTNKGTALLIIRSLKTSCPCASVALKIDKHKTPYFGTEGSPKDWQVEIKPEETAELEVMVDLASPHVKPGKLIRDASIISNDPVYPEVIVRVEAEVKD